jgi:hypothetical protein
VWGRPSLMALEVLWRWIFGAALLCSVYTALGRFGPQAQRALNAVEGLSFFQPVVGVQTITEQLGSLLRLAWPQLRWLLPAAFVAWNMMAAAGRTIVLRRLDPSLKPRRTAMFCLGTVRSALLLGAWGLWFWLVVESTRVAITGPAALQQEPSVVLFSAMMIVGTLLLYVIWAIFSWFLYLAPLLAMRRDTGPVAALRASLTATHVYGKLIEINLVMNIEKLALIVLAMVGSASPLAFTTAASQGFLYIWWIVVVLIYFIFSDYFHVVREAAYLALWKNLGESQEHVGTLTQPFTLKT